MVYLKLISNDILNKFEEKEERCVTFARLYSMRENLEVSNPLSNRKTYIRFFH